MTEQLVRARKGGPPFALLQPVHTEPRYGLIEIVRDPSRADLDNILDDMGNYDLIALDFETKGTDPTEPDTEIVGVSLAGPDFVLYVQLDLLSDDDYRYFLFYLAQLPLLCHNAFFEDQWFYRSARDTRGDSFRPGEDLSDYPNRSYNGSPIRNYRRLGHANIQYCTYALYVQLANEGFEGQKHGLKPAMKDLLNWWDTNDKDLVEWLISEGWTTNRPAWRPDRGDTPGAAALKLEKIQKAVDEGVHLVADRSQMWRAPVEILGHYGALDADATWQIFTHVLEPALREERWRGPEVDRYHREEFMCLLQILVEQKDRGLRLNVRALEDYKFRLVNEMYHLQEQFFRLDKVRDYIDNFRRERIALYEEKRPEKYLKCPEPGPEPEKWKPVKERKKPEQYKKDGTISKNYLAWEQWYNEVFLAPREIAYHWDLWEKRRIAYENPELSKNYVRWAQRRRLQEIDGWRESTYGSFSIGSGQQLQDLLYGYLFSYKVLKEHSGPERGQRGKILLYGPERNVELDMTESGGLPTDESALLQMGEPGKILLRWKDKDKQRSYIESYITKQREGILRPSWKVPGTLTGRLAGANPNLQQCFHPKTEVLTKGRGFVPILDLLLEDTVWQVDPQTLQGSWVKPLAITQREYEGDMYTFGGHRGSFSVTEDHRVLWLGQQRSSSVTQRNTRYEMRAKDDFGRQRVEVALTTLPTTEEPSHTWWDIWMSCMIQADGSVDRSDIYGLWRIGVSRPEKVAAVEALLGTKSNYQYTCKSGKVAHHWSQIGYQSELLKGKSLHLESLSNAHVDEFVEALVFWDGYWRGTSTGSFAWYSTDKYSVDQVQKYLVRNGYQARVTFRQKDKGHYVWEVSGKKCHYTELYKDKHIKVSKYQGRVGCLSVPTGYVLIRSEGQTFVTGQCPKVREVLESFLPVSPGNVLVDCDETALEMVVLAEQSRDPSLLKIYGPGAAPNCIYLYVGSTLPGTDSEIRAAGYDPRRDHTADEISHVKKAAKKARDISKIDVLSSGYGAGVDKKYMTFILKGIDISYETVRQRHELYWELFSGVKVYERSLQEQWKRNHGWIINGYGRPICVDQKAKKDLVNRDCQSTGHDLHTRYVYHLVHLLDESGIPWFPWCMDWHDQSIVEASPENSELVRDIMERRAYELLAEETPDALIPITGGATICKNLADAKL